MKGIHKVKATGKWIVTFNSIYYGSFNTQEEAIAKLEIILNSNNSFKTMYARRREMCWKCKDCGTINCDTDECSNPKCPANKKPHFVEIDTFPKVGDEF